MLTYADVCCSADKDKMNNIFEYELIAVISCVFGGNEKDWNDGDAEVLALLLALLPALGRSKDSFTTRGMSCPHVRVR